MDAYMDEGAVKIHVCNYWVISLHRTRRPVQ